MVARARSFAITILIIGSIGPLAGCASRRAKTLSCNQRDWYEIGRQDGAQGAPLDHVGRYRTECGGTLQIHDEMIYANGRHAGLVEYCQVESAFQVGRAGQPYHDVCPAPIDEAFLASYRRGQRARELEQRYRDLDAEIESLSDRLLRAEDSPAQRRLTVRLHQLRQARVRTERELNKHQLKQITR